MWHVPAGQIELGERRGRNLAGLADSHRAGRRQVEGALQAAAKHISGRHAGLQQVLNARCGLR